MERENPGRNSEKQQSIHAISDEQIASAENKSNKTTSPWTELSQNYNFLIILSKILTHKKPRKIGVLESGREDRSKQFTWERVEADG